MSTHRRLPSSLPVLDTGRLLLRGVTVADIDDLQAVYGDREVMRFASDAVFTHETEYLQTVASIERNLVQDVAIEWGMVLKSSGAMVGVIGLHHLEGGQAEIGCLLNRADWGRGLMREAVLAVQEVAASVGVVRLEAEIDVGNTRSERLFSRLGFVRTGEAGASTVWVKDL